MAARLFGLLALLVLCGASGLRAQDCRSITPTGPCVFRDSRSVVFGPTTIPRIAPVPAPVTPAPHPHATLAPAPAKAPGQDAAPPVDCAMIKTPPATHDPMKTISSDVPGVTFAARVIAVPACK